MKIRKTYTCPLEITHDIIRGKWKPIILWQLSKQPACSLSKLKKNIHGINEKMLLEQLDELLKFEIIGKNKFLGYPLKVEYYLKERGIKLFEAVTIMQEVGENILNKD
ncbi:winged helix-turn-helix transcriptional regulator [Enterococcus sp. LJL99]